MKEQQRAWQGKKIVRSIESLKGSRFYIGSEIKSQFGKIDEKEYISKVNTPARDGKYFETFHDPLIQRLHEKNKDQPIKLVDVACGFGYELDFLASDNRVEIYGIDIAAEPLEKARSRIGRGNFSVHDVRSRRLPYPKESMDVAIAVNAVIYSPDDMLRTIHDLLKPDGEAVINFRPFSSPFNKEFYDFYRNTGGTIYDQSLVLENGTTFTLKVVDYRTCTDPTDQAKDRQVYFQNENDITAFIKAMQFDIIDHQKFYFTSPQNSKNEIVVFRLKKVKG